MKIYISDLSIKKETVLLNKLMSVQSCRGDAGEKRRCTVYEIRCDWDSSGVVVAFIRYKVCANGCGPIFVFAGL